MKIFLFIIVYISVLKVREAYVSPNGRIFNGHNALNGKYPYVVSVQYCEFSPFECWHLCGGIILASTWILSSAHCYYDREPLHFVISAGNVNLLAKFPHRQIIRVNRIVLHPYFAENNASTHDLALLKLQRPLLFYEYIQPARLSDGHDFIRRQTIVVGWGKTETGRLVSPMLQEVEVIPLKYRSCRNFVIYFHGLWIIWKTINKRFTLCTQNMFDKNGPCPGDSGGPLISNGKVVGIITFNTISCGHGLPTFYVKISPHLDWIKNYVTFGD